MPEKPSLLKASVLSVRAGLAAFRAAHDDNQRRYIAGLLQRDKAVLAEQCLRRTTALNAAYDWIESHKDDPNLTPDELKAREERWILSLRQYETAMDLLGEVLEVIRSTPKPEPAVSRQPIPMAPPIQEAFL